MVLPIVSPLIFHLADTICSSDHCGSWLASSLKNVSCLGGVKRNPSGTPGFLFRKEPVARRRVTHSIGIMSHFFEMKAVGEASLTKAVLIPGKGLFRMYDRFSLNLKITVRLPTFR